LRRTLVHSIFTRQSNKIKAAAMRLNLSILIP